MEWPRPEQYIVGVSVTMLRRHKNLMMSLWPRNILAYDILHCWAAKDGIKSPRYTAHICIYLPF